MRARAAVAAIALAFAPATAAVAPDAADAPVPVRQRVIEDFDGTLRAPAWHAFGGEDGGRVAIRRLADGGNPALHVTYAFAADAGAPGDERANQELGVRIGLDAIDATDYDHLRFRIRGDGTLGHADALKVEFRRPQPPLPGLYEKGSFLVTGIRDGWREVTVPLDRMTGITEWTRIDGLVLLLQSRRSPVRAGGFLIDDIRFVTLGERGPGVRDRVAAKKKEAWEASRGGREAARPEVYARLAGWPQRLLVDRNELPADDAAFLRRLARDTWNGLAAFVDRDSGLPIDNVHFAGDVAPGHARIGDYTNITNIGLYLIAAIGAVEIGILPEAEAQARIDRVLATLDRLERHRGFFFNYYDTTSLERTSHFISFVDSSWLTAGLIAVRSRFPEFRARVDAMVDAGDYGFFYDDVVQQMHHGYYVHLNDYAEYHYGLLYSESRLGSLIAIGKGDAPPVHWFRLARTFPETFGWQTQRPLARGRRETAGQTYYGGHYRLGDLAFVPSCGGSLFEALMPVLVLDESRYAPASLGVNGLLHAEIQRDHALDELGYPVWGMSPSMDPLSGGYSEFGVRALGVRGYKAGVVTPHASALALAVLPADAAANLRRLAAHYDLYGDFGFYDAVVPRTGRVAYGYLTLDQAMLFIAVANHLQPGCVQRVFEADPIMATALRLIGEEKFFE